MDTSAEIDEYHHKNSQQVQIPALSISSSACCTTSWSSKDSTGYQLVKIYVLHKSSILTSQVDANNLSSWTYLSIEIKHIILLKKFC
jgi:hypothetical protein